MIATHNPFEDGFYSLAAPTTEAQREIWATMQMSMDASLAYNEVVEVSLNGNLGLQALKDSLQSCLGQHDVLRSVYAEGGKTFLIKEFTPVDLTLIDLTLNENKVQRLEEIKRNQVLSPFDLKNGPCIRFVLIKMGPQNHSLLVAAHHIVCDGWSFAILLAEIGQTYTSLLLNKNLLTQSVNQFADYAVEEFRNGQESLHKKYWLGQFKQPLNINSFPTDFKRPAFRTYESQFLKIEIADELVLKLKRLGMSQKSSFYNVLMANFMILLRRISHSHDLVVGVASAAQSGTGKHDLVGHLVNLLPIRTTLDEELNFADFLRSLRTTMLDAFDHQFFSYGTLLRELNITRNPAEIPLLNCVFNIDQQSPGQGLSFFNLEASYAVVPRAYENFELFVNAVSCENTLSIECQYNSVLFKRSTIENWFECYVELLNLSVQDANVPVRNMVLKKLMVPSQVAVSEVVKILNVVRNFDTEARVGRLWAKVLSVESVSAEDNFFVLGGHSLLAVELAVLLQNEFKKEISIKDIFENPTVIEFAAKISEMSQVPVPQVVLETKPGITVGPVSHNQMQIWYVEKLFAATKMHNLSTSLRIKWGINSQLLEKTIHYFIQRHAALRTAIEVENELPYQKIYDESDSVFRPALEVVKTDETKVFELMRLETAQPFNKARPPMFRAKLYQLGPSEYIFFFMVHHAVWDGWCFDIFFEELDVIYTAFEKDMTPVFKKNPDLRYLDHTLWMQKSLESGVFQSQLNYWKHKLSSPLPILEVPADFKRPLTASHDGGNFRFSLSPEQIKNLKDYASSKNSTVFNVMLTAFKITMAHHTGLQDIIVGSPVRGRNTPELLQTIGYFVNTLALRSHIDLEQNFEENLKRVTTTCLEAFAHQDLPFEILLRNIEYPKDLSRTAIFQTFFTFQDMTNRQFYINERPVKQVSVNNASAKTDLDIWVKVTTTGIEGAFEYRSDLFENATIEQFYKCFESVISHLSEAQPVPKLIKPRLKDFKVVSQAYLQETSENNIYLSQMKEIWQDVLDLREISDDDIFFDIGGNSLLAVRLFLLISKRYHLDLNLSDLVQAPDLKSFSRVLIPKNSPTVVAEKYSLSNSLVPIRQTGTANPVFFFHGVGGNILNYLPLTKCVDEKRPVYALQSLGMDGRTEARQSIEEMACHYIKEIKAINPTGSCVLIGGSMGGMIALEVAQQLKNTDIKIEKLIMLDTFGPDINIQSYNEGERSFFNNLKISLFYRKKTLVNRVRKAFYKMIGHSVPIDIRLFETEMSNYRALWKYQPQPYNGDLLLIRAKRKATGWYRDPMMGWGKTILGVIHTFEIEGSHSAFIEAPELGSIISTLLKIS